MAMWDLNCQSNPSSADDKELAPYLARQKAMREFFERALFVPKDQDNNGLYFLGATTGSGKNYTAEQVTADLIAGGWDDSGCFNKCPGRRYLVFVVPGKDNRDNYVASVRKLLVEQGMDGDAAQRADRERVHHVQHGDVDHHAGGAVAPHARGELLAQRHQVGVGHRSLDGRDQVAVLLEDRRPHAPRPSRR